MKEGSSWLHDNDEEIKSHITKLWGAIRIDKASSLEKGWGQKANL